MHIHHGDDHACMHPHVMIGRSSSIFKIKRNKKKNYSTEYSHVVPHHSTDSAINCLTAQIGRDAVGLVVYGRNSKVIGINLFLIG